MTAARSNSAGATPWSSKKVISTGDGRETGGNSEKLSTEGLLMP
jgi:hypothetical protein